MIKRTLFFGNPAYLQSRNQQMVIILPEPKVLPEKDRSTTIPIEDIGVVVLENSQITITHQLLDNLLANNVAVITCDERHMPAGMLLPLSGNNTQSERFSSQINASEPLRKQLWQQTVKQKILNQAALLNQEGYEIQNMRYWSNEVKSGDTENHEGRAAAYFWSKIFEKYVPDFRRAPEGFPPNNLLNYGYAILRAVVARSLVASGLLPTLGIHHHNRYNAYCLADDIMEPYRPYVDALVVKLVKSGQLSEELTKEQKTQLLSIPVLDVTINNRRSPLMLATQQTSASLAKCFLGEARKTDYPDLSCDLISKGI
jgi:CRISPR-associated protein Cas1